MLMLITWSIRRRPLHRKVVECLSLVDSCLRLWNELRPQHIAIPFRSLINRDLDTLLGGLVGRVLERRREVHVFLNST